MAWTRAQVWLTTRWAARSEKGGNMVEYMLMLTLIAVIVILVLTNIGHEVSTRFSSASSQLP